MPIATCEGPDVIENELSRHGAEYEVANGATIPNLGKRRCEAMTVGRVQPKRITFQVAEVPQPLLSISGCADMGFDCFLGQSGGQLRVESLVSSFHWKVTAVYTPCRCG